MANLGPRSSKHLVILTGWDADELEKLSLEDGTTYRQVVAMMQGGLAAIVNEFTNSWYSGLFYVTSEPTVEYRVGSSNGFERYTEYGRPDAKRGATEGHMLPLIPFDRGLGWTWEFLRKARPSQLQADMADTLKDVRDLMRQEILGRCLQRGDDSGSANGLGSSGYSPGFATTAASTSVDFDPPDYNGTSFDNTHEHYVAIAGGAFTNAVFQDAKDELHEHGHNPPYEFITGPSDEDTIRGLSDFTPVPEQLVNYGATQDVARASGMTAPDGSYIIGTIEDFNVRVVRGVPQYYGFGWKSYGRNSQRNPLYIRTSQNDPMNGALRVVAMPDPRENSGQLPLQHLMLFTEFGVGVGDRTNGTARYVNNATWADGTVS